jgi:hypothetical protein
MSEAQSKSWSELAPDIIIINFVSQSLLDAQLIP